MRHATPRAPRALGVAAAVLVALGPSAGAAAPGPIEDDYPRALALAKERGVPILVDVWAPW